MDGGGPERMEGGGPDPMDGATPDAMLALSMSRMLRHARASAWTPFDNIALDEMGKPTEAAITTLRAELECTARATQTRAPSETVVQKVRAATLA